MGDVLVETPTNHVHTHKKNALSAIPSIENFEGTTAEGNDEYANLKRLQRQLEYIQLQEEYIKDEQRYGRRPICERTARSWTNCSNRSLKRELVRAQEEIKRIQSVPLVIGQFMEAIDQK
jgi:26S proteasome regulatory subunit T3